MARSSSRFYVRTIAVVVAVLIGVIIGSWTELFDDSPSNDSSILASQPTKAPMTGMVSLSSDKSATSAHQVTSEIPPEESNPVVLGSEGVRVRATRDDTGFLGYRVLDKGGDVRLRDDAIIVSINGTPVEDSAAGSELLLIALESEDSQIKLAEVGEE